MLDRPFTLIMYQFTETINYLHIINYFISHLQHPDFSLRSREASVTTYPYRVSPGGIEIVRLLFDLIQMYVSILESVNSVEIDLAEETHYGDINNIIT